MSASLNGSEFDGYYQLSNDYLSFSRPVWINSEFSQMRIKWVPNSWIIENNDIYTDYFQILSFDSSLYFPPTNDMIEYTSGATWTHLIESKDNNSTQEKTSFLSLECIATDLPTEYPTDAPSNIPTNNPTTTASPTTIPTPLPSDEPSIEPTYNPVTPAPAESCDILHIQEIDILQEGDNNENSSILLIETLNNSYFISQTSLFQNKQSWWITDSDKISNVLSDNSATESDYQDVSVSQVTANDVIIYFYDNRWILTVSLSTSSSSGSSSGNVYRHSDWYFNSTYELPPVTENRSEEWSNSDDDSDDSYLVLKMICSDEYDSISSLLLSGIFDSDSGGGNGSSGLFGGLFEYADNPWFWVVFVLSIILIVCILGFCCWYGKYSSKWGKGRGREISDIENRLDILDAEPIDNDNYNDDDDNGNAHVSPNVNYNAYASSPRGQMNNNNNYNNRDVNNNNNNNNGNNNDHDGESDEEYFDNDNLDVIARVNTSGGGEDETERPPAPVSRDKSYQM